VATKNTLSYSIEKKEQGMNKWTHESIWAELLRHMRALLLERGMTRARLAALMGVNRGTVTRWLKGERTASRSNAEVVAGYMRALGLDPARFFGGDEDASYTQIPWLVAEASMGSGSLEVSKEVISHLSFQTSWILSKGNPGKMVVINAVGDSMSPTIPDGAVVLINEAAKEPINGKIYFVRCGSEIYLKRLRVKNGQVLALISDAPHVPEKTPDPAEPFEILGRAVWCGWEVY
jgi:phage repressor protein C with HTH and peptisase S24 domain